MQMTEAVTLFNGWSGFCDIQETVAQKGEISNWCSFIVAEHFSHFPASTVNADPFQLQNVSLFYPRSVQKYWRYLWMENRGLQLTFERPLSS